MCSFRIASSTDSREAAKALFKEMMRSGFTRITAVGAKAVNNAVKAIIICSRYTSAEGARLYFTPTYLNERMDDGIDDIRVVTCLDVEMKSIVAS